MWVNDWPCFRNLGVALWGKARLHEESGTDGLLDTIFLMYVQIIAATSTRTAQEELGKFHDFEMLSAS